MRRSVATLDSPEFLNIQSISPLISKCEVKVLYVGENRNRSFITKQVASEMAQTLPGCPIVGYYIENKEDFGDHGDQVIIDGEGIKFKKLTTPYGFIAPDSKIWFQKFEDTDDFGNVEVREYLMTEGYLWTGQFQEAQRVIDKGNPQSMELDEKTLKGYWSEDTNKGIEFFIINDAIFSKLCILGEDVEPCFEGASVTAPQVSTSFAKDDNFNQSLYTMIKELQYTLNKVEGELEMPGEENFSKNQGENVETPNLENQTNIENQFQSSQQENDSVNEVDNSDATASNTESEESTDFAKCEEEDKTDKEDKEDEKDDKDEDKKDEEDEYACGDKKKKYSLLEKELEDLKVEFDNLKSEYQKLEAFKAEVEDQKKDELINSFYMLSDEDKADVIENKAKYSLDDIEAKLSIICFRKKVNFAVDTQVEENNTVEAPVIYNLDAQEADVLPAWLKAVDEHTKNN